MKKPTRYVLEGTWSGYRSSQSRVCHREVIPARLVERYSRVKTIQFDDLTTLELTIRPAAPRERVEVNKQYSDLIYKAAYSEYEGCVSVEMLRRPKAGAA